MNEQLNPIQIVLPKTFFDRYPGFEVSSQTALSEAYIQRSDDAEGERKVQILQEGIDNAERKGEFLQEQYQDLREYLAGVLLPSELPEKLMDLKVKLPKIEAKFDHELPSEMARLGVIVEASIQLQIAIDKLTKAKQAITGEWRPEKTEEERQVA